MKHMKQTDIGLMRLVAQRLTNTLDKPEDVVKHLLAMQAQDYAGGLWSVGVRTKNGTLQDVEQAIRGRKIIRTWPMRGTLHFVHADDVHWLLKLLAPRATAAAKNRRLSMGLTDEIVASAEAAMRNTLKGGKSIARNNVVKMLNDSVPEFEFSNQHTQHLMRNFGERGLICFGPHEGKQPTFVLLDEWVTPPVEKPRDKALVELAQRYFTSHGPASLKDFAGWGMMTMADAKAGLAGADLASADLNGVIYYFAKGLKPLPQPAPLLLAGFDEYLLGYKNREAVLRLEHSNKIVPGGNGMFLPTVIENGNVVGLWKRKLTTKNVTFTYDCFDKTITAPEAEERYRHFLRLSSTV
jgi:hypothetical protein